MARFQMEGVENWRVGELIAQAELRMMMARECWLVIHYRRVSRPEDCKLYFVELEELLKNDTHVHQRCLESLASVSKGLITIDHLRLMAHNPRHQLYVLLGPTANWSNEHGLTTYCAIQVCIEGEIPDMPELAEHDFLREQVKDAFIVSALSSKSLKGARLVHILTSLDAPEQGYDLTSLNCLTRLRCKMRVLPSPANYMLMRIVDTRYNRVVEFNFLT
ncbi:hypothetical protein L1049_012228 [Liquidambar formosana]|uniref:N-acetyltransferase domain-containing protein n=1 Tax=Liquidambar formosana TaxID=63359 RepID=A0AAP0RZH9_LIQFO